MSNRTALITGASKGIGAATARHLAAEGWSVACLARSEGALKDLVAEIEAAGGTALAIAADVADNAAMKSAIERTVETFGSLDLLVNNAGPHRPYRAAGEQRPGRMVHDRRCESERRLLRHSPRPAGDAGAGRRHDRQHFVGCRQQPRGRLVALLRNQGGGEDADRADAQGGRTAYPLHRSFAGNRRHRHAAGH